MLGLCALIAAGACHEKGVVVSSLTLVGVHAFTVAEVTQALATQATGWLPWSTKRYFDRGEFEADLNRIHAFYADHGYPHQRVRKVDVTFNTRRTALRARVEIEEGTPVIVDEVRFQGFDELPPAARGQLDQVPLHRGQPRNGEVMRNARALGARLYRDNGHPMARVDTTEEQTTPDHVIVTFTATPGPTMRFGDVSYEGLRHVNEPVVRRMLRFKAGDLYRESLVLEGQRRLAGLDLFQLATVAPTLEAVQGDRVPVRVTLVEGPPRRLNFGVGYGTDDRARGLVHWQHLNFLGGTRQLTLDGRMSFIGESARVSLLEPYVGRPDVSMTISGSVERQQQLTYDSETYGGRIRFAYRTERGRQGNRGHARYQASLEYAHEYLRYGIQASALRDLSQRDERIQLGLDPETGRGAGTLASVGLDLRRIAVDDMNEPRHGTVVSLHLEHAAPWLLGSYRFDEFRVDARRFMTAGPLTLETRAQFGTVLGADPSKVPFSKRYFLGGATTLRGWGRFQVSPLDASGLPIGGRSLFAATVEAGFPLRDKLSGAVFLDAGNVWSSGLTAEAKHLRTDVGPGLRYRTPVGLVSVDLGYQLTRIPGLIVNGAPERRRWRLQLNIGRPF